MPPIKKLPSVPRMGAPSMPVPVRTKKTFSIEPWYGQGEGEKIIVYGASGMGKTTLCALAPKPVFVGIDDGGRKIRHPVTGEVLSYIPGIETFQDVRDAIVTPGLFDDYQTIVVDTATELESLAEDWVLDNIPTGARTSSVKSLNDYGYGKGFQHLYDAMKLPLQDVGPLVRQGKNIIFIAQSAPHNIANPGGENFLREGPRLYSDKRFSVEACYCEWADHVLRVDYQSVGVKDHKVRGNTERVVYCVPELHFRAKSRTISPDITCVTFSTPQDDSIWKYVFAGKDGE